MVMRPCCGSKKRKISREIVDLPAPDGPTMASVLPARNLEINAAQDFRAGS